MLGARATAGLVLLWAALHSSGVRAQAPQAVQSGDAREEARTLGYAGVRAYGSGDYASASAQLERSFALLPVPTLGLWSARTLVKLSKLVEAEQRYRAVVKMRVAAADSDVQHAARETARAELLELLPRIPSLRVQIAGAPADEVAITLDGVPLPLQRWQQGEPVNPGPHQLTGTHRGQRVALDITVSEGRESEALLTFAPPEASADVQPRAALPPFAQGPAAPGAESASSAEAGAGGWQLGGWITVGAASASLSASVVSYLLAREQHEELQASGACRGQRCEPSAGLDRYGDLRSVQLATLVGGLALGAAGATILLLQPGAPAAASSGALQLRLGLGSASLGASF